MQRYHYRLRVEEQQARDYESFAINGQTRIYHVCVL